MRSLQNRLKEHQKATRRGQGEIWLLQDMPGRNNITPPMGHITTVDHALNENILLVKEVLHIMLVG